MKNLHIENSYNIWSPFEMRARIQEKAFEVYAATNPEELLDRTYLSMYVEWWLHNIGYYLTKPFPLLLALNERFKHVDINE